MTIDKEKNLSSDVLRIAVVDDDEYNCRTIASFLKPLQCPVETYCDALHFLEVSMQNGPDILILDLRMPSIDGLDVLKEVKKRRPETDVVIISGTADKLDAIQALKLGAFDFFEKPVSRDEMLATVKRTIRYREVVRERNRFADQLSFVSQQEAKRWGIGALVGKSEAIHQVVENIIKLQRAADTSVLITGESGTGKELVARAIHFGSPRASRLFVPVNCSAIPSELAESTLFGHVKGSFTGATSDRQGCFETAHEGTIFLDEIGDMPAAIQIKLLRVLEDGVIIPVGRATGQTVNARVIAATNADIHAKIEAGQFRADLFYRLAAFNFSLPPLRSRKGDIPLLVEHFANLFCTEMGMPVPQIEPTVMELLSNHDFPGNIRELKNMIERALIESGGGKITTSHIHFLRAPAPAAHTPKTPRDKAASASLPANFSEAGKMLAEKAVAAANGNIAEAARQMGISRQKLYRLIETKNTDS